MKPQFHPSIQRKLQWAPNWRDPKHSQPLRFQFLQSQSLQEIQKLQAEQQAANFAAAQQFELDRMQTMLGINMAQVTGEEQARLADEQSRLNRQSQLLATGVSVLGDVAGSYLTSRSAPGIDIDGDGRPD